MTKEIRPFTEAAFALLRVVHMRCRCSATHMFRGKQAWTLPSEAQMLGYSYPVARDVCIGAAWNTSRAVPHADEAPYSSKIVCKAISLEREIPWQLMTWELAQAGDRASKTGRILQ